MDNRTLLLQSNPRANYLVHEKETDAAIARVLDSGQYIFGNEVEAFARAPSYTIYFRYTNKKDT
jgi:dTDP-4-amino-4,6-dideoxygalactose transaminase